jgi:hypothetical protein
VRGQRRLKRPGGSAGRGKGNRSAGRYEEARQMMESGIARAELAGNKHAQEEMQGLLQELR